MDAKTLLILILIARGDLVAVGSHADVDDGGPVLLDQAAEVWQRRNGGCGGGHRRRCRRDGGARLMERDPVSADHADRERARDGKRDGRASESLGLHRSLLGG